MVWKWAVGNNEIHILKRKGRLGNVYCYRGAPWGHDCRDICTYQRDENNLWRPTMWPKDTRPLALLLTCRQIYSETVNLLYSENHFVLDNSATGIAFFQSILPSRVQCLTSIQISVSFFRHDFRMMHYHIPKEDPDQDSETWQLFCRYICSICGLKSLRIVPSDPFRSENYGTWSHTNRHPVPLILRPQVTKAITEYTSVNIENFDVYAPAGYFDDGSPFLHQRQARLELPDNPYFTLHTMSFVDGGTSPALRTFFIPFNTKCLHCHDYRIILKCTKGYAEVIGPAQPIAGSYITHYWTFHAACGGWLEYVYLHSMHSFAIAQGGDYVSDEEAERHIARAGRKVYPKIPPPIEQLRVIYDMDHITLLSYYRNLKDVQPWDMPFELQDGRIVCRPGMGSFFQHGLH